MAHTILRTHTCCHLLFVECGLSSDYYFTGLPCITSNNSPVFPGVDSALDKISKNAEGHVGHIFDAAQHGFSTKEQVSLEGHSLGIFGRDSPGRALSSFQFSPMAIGICKREE